MNRYINLIALAALLSACTANHHLHHDQAVSTTNAAYPAKKPETVAIYDETHSPKSPYRIIGIAKVANNNLFGLKRPDTAIQSTMKKLAASLGGDGLINVSHSEHEIEANIIAFQRIMI